VGQRDAIPQRAVERALDLSDEVILLKPRPAAFGSPPSVSHATSSVASSSSSLDARHHKRTPPGGHLE
jgi:hypothetical protein